jgi:N-acetylmuramic acid 6-phosphate etherase
MAMPRTEVVEDRFDGIDLWSSADALAALAEGQIRGALSVRAAIPALAAAAEQAAACIARGGRLVYFGAGSSGLLALVDALEIPQTFSIPQSQILVLMAGGMAMTETLTGGPEDVAELGVADIESAKLGPNDCVVAASASGSTPYTVAGLEAARKTGAATVAIACNASAPLFAHADIAVFLDSGPEVLAGSTRMGAGTAQKAAFNMLSTMIAIRLGHVVDGMMVNVRADNAKLRNRAARIISRIAGVDDAAAVGALDAAEGEVKPAILIAAGATSFATAGALLATNAGNLRAAMSALAKSRIA